MVGREEALVVEVGVVGRSRLEDLVLKAQTGSRMLAMFVVVIKIVVNCCLGNMKYEDVRVCGVKKRRWKRERGEEKRRRRRRRSRRGGE